MTLIVLYVVTAVIFLGLDAVGLKFLIKPIFDRHVGDLMADPFRIVPAVGFYLAYMAGVLWFVSVPALRDDAPAAALVNGALLGLLCYATYEVTNYATLAAWSWQQVVADVIWGGFLTGVSAWLGVTITRAVT